MSLTRPQERLLRALNEGARIIMGAQGCRWSQSKWNTVIGKPRRNIAKALIAHGYVEAVAEWGSGAKSYAITEEGARVIADTPTEQLAQETKLKVSARDVLRALRRYYLSGGWVMATEVMVPGIAYERRRIDAYFVSPYRNETVTVEVKVSRADWLTELTDPDKLRSSRRYSHFAYIAAPDGVVREAELPDGVGHMTYLPLDKTIVLSRSADCHEPDEPTWNLVGRVAAGALRAAREVP